MRHFARNSISFCFLVFCFNFLHAFSISKEVFEFSEPSNCKSNEYFQTNSFSCIECDVSKNLEPSADRLRCVCNKYSKTSGFKNGYPICTFCGINATVTVDGKDCVTCKDASCECPSTHIQIDRHLNGTLLDTMYCLLCSNNTYPSKDRSKCLTCDNLPHIRHTYCACPPISHIRVQDYCLRKDDLSDWLDVRSTYLIKFDSQNIDSYYFRSELQTAMYFCKQKDKLACEHLSNMCALTLYTDGIPCMLFVQAHITPIWLFYNKDETDSTLNGKQISQRYSLMKNDNNSSLNVTTTTFSLEGNLQSIGEPNLPCNLLKHIRFGVNYKKKCKLTIKDLLNAKMEFISPYLTFVNNEKLLMHPIPVLIKNINENIDKITHWRLVRKFFLVDNISGFKTLPGSMNGTFKKDSDLSALRYAKSVNLQVHVQNGENRGKIFPPLLIIKYAELTHKEIVEDVEIVLEYRITYTLKDNNIDYTLEISIGILSGLAIIFSGIKTWSHSKRHYTCIRSLSVLFWFLIYTMGAVGNMIILSSISLCVYLFIFYKGQTVPYILLPDDNNERNIQICTIVAFCFKLVEVMGYVYQYWHVRIFFIDWEQPRITHSQFKYDSPHTSLRKMYSKRLLKVDRVQTPSEVIAAKRKRRAQKSNKNDSESSIPKSCLSDNYETEFSTVCSLLEATRVESSDNSNNLSVSIWRTYFVANQWIKLQTKRKISIILQFIATLCIFQIIQLYSWTLAVPELSTAESIEGNSNFTLYYAVCCLVYILIYFTQWLVSIAFYERYIKNRMQEFIDLCSIANISVFILPFNYYGFYIHGRSVHGFADTDLPTLVKNLRKEENNLCAHRGLMPGSIEQTFILSLTATFTNIFDKLSKRIDIGTNNFVKEPQSPSLHWDQVFHSRSKLKQFLCEFIDHCYKDEDYVIKEQHFLEKLCDILFTRAKEKSVFYIDNNHSFDQVLFYGNEWLLATFEITTFAFIIVLYNDYTLASVVTVLVSMSMIIVTKYNGKVNLSNKALLDKRLLME